MCVPPRPVQEPQACGGLEARRQELVGLLGTRLVFLCGLRVAWIHFGGVLGAHMEAKAIKKPSQKNIKKMMPKMTPNWSQRGAQNGTKIVKNEVLEAPCFKGGSQVASRAPPG